MSKASSKSTRQMPPRGKSAPPPSSTAPASSAAAGGNQSSGEELHKLTFMQKMRTKVDHLYVVMWDYTEHLMPSELSLKRGDIVHLIREEYSTETVAVPVVRPVGPKEKTPIHPIVPGPLPPPLAGAKVKIKPAPTRPGTAAAKTSSHAALNKGSLGTMSFRNARGRGGSNKSSLQSVRGGTSRMTPQTNAADATPSTLNGGGRGAAAPEKKGAAVINAVQPASSGGLSSESTGQQPNHRGWKWALVKRLDSGAKGYILRSFLVNYDYFKEPIHALIQQKRWFVGPMDRLRATMILKEEPDTPIGTFVVCQTPGTLNTQTTYCEYQLIVKTKESTEPLWVESMRVNRDRRGRYKIINPINNEELAFNNLYMVLIALQKSSRGKDSSLGRVHCFSTPLLTGPENLQRPPYDDKHNQAPAPPSRQDDPAAAIAAVNKGSRKSVVSLDDRTEFEYTNEDRMGGNNEEKSKGQRDGGFGDVYKVIWRSSHETLGSEPKVVAVRELNVVGVNDQANNYKVFARSLLKLTERLSTDQSPFLLPYVGLLSCSRPFLLCMEMAGLALDKHLREFGSKSRKAIDFRSRVLNKTPVCLQQQIEIVWQIAMGLSYLEKRSIVHGALNARNCLVVDERQDVILIKVSDYGLARWYDRAVAKSRLRWEAVEVWEEAERLTTATDVWAFGVTIVEVLTHGGRPYPDQITDQDLIQHLRVPGRRAKRPPNVHAGDAGERLWRLAEECWWDPASHRPKPDECAARVQLLWLADARFTPL